MPLEDFWKERLHMHLLFDHQWKFLSATTHLLPWRSPICEACRGASVRGFAGHVRAVHAAVVH